MRREVRRRNRGVKAKTVDVDYHVAIMYRATLFIMNVMESYLTTNSQVVRLFLPNPFLCPPFDDVLALNVLPPLLQISDQVNTSTIVATT